MNVHMYTYWSAFKNLPSSCQFEYKLTYKLKKKDITKLPMHYKNTVVWKNYVHKIEEI